MKVVGSLLLCPGQHPDMQNCFIFRNMLIPWLFINENISADWGSISQQKTWNFFFDKKKKKKGCHCPVSNHLHLKHQLYLALFVIDCFYIKKKKKAQTSQPYGGLLWYEIRAGCMGLCDLWALFSRFFANIACNTFQCVSVLLSWNALKSWWDHVHKNTTSWVDMSDCKDVLHRIKQ